MGNPYIPYILEKSGTRIQVSVVHKTMNLNEILTFPSALKIFINGEEYETMNEDIQKI